MKAIWDSIVYEFQTRKFRAFLVSLLGILGAWLTDEVTPEKALALLVAAVIGYSTGVAVEDGLKKRA